MKAKWTARLRAAYLAKEEGDAAAKEIALKLARSLINESKEAGYTNAADPG